MPKVDYILSARKQMPIFILVEKTNESYVDEHINEVLTSIKNILVELNRSPDFDVLVAMYSFSSTDTSFRTKTMICVDDCNPNTLLDNSCVDLSNVFCQLNGDMSSTTMLKSETGYMWPYVLLVVAGNKKYYGHNELNSIKKNKWFAISRKIVLTFSDITENSTSVVSQFAGNKEAIIKINNKSQYEDLLRQHLVGVNFTWD